MFDFEGDPIICPTPGPNTDPDPDPDPDPDADLEADQKHHQPRPLAPPPAMPMGAAGTTATPGSSSATTATTGHGGAAASPPGPGPGPGFSFGSASGTNDATTKVCARRGTPIHPHACTWPTPHSEPAPPMFDSLAFSHPTDPLSDPLSTTAWRHIQVRFAFEWWRGGRHRVSLWPDAATFHRRFRRSGKGGVFVRRGGGSTLAIRCVTEWRDNLHLWGQA